MDCQICGNEVSNTSFDPPIILKDGVVHKSCQTSQKVQSLKEQFPLADTYVLSVADIERFKSNKYCVEIETHDLNSSCGGTYVDIEYFGTTSEFNDFLRDEIFDNSIYNLKTVTGLHVNQKKTKFEYRAFYYNPEDEESKRNVLYELDEISQGSYESTNEKLWSMGTDEVQDLLDEIINSHHYQHLKFKDTKG